MTIASSVGVPAGTPWVSSPAGLTAAIGLARAGFAVAVVEAAAFPGAENWSGCVYFCENLAHPDILGPEGVEALAWVPVRLAAIARANAGWWWSRSGDWC